MVAIKPGQWTWNWGDIDPSWLDLGKTIRDFSAGERGSKGLGVYIPCWSDPQSDSMAQTNVMINRLQTGDRLNGGANWPDGWSTTLTPYGIGWHADGTATSNGLLTKRTRDLTDANSDPFTLYALYMIPTDNSNNRTIFSFGDDGDFFVRANGTGGINMDGEMSGFSDGLNGDGKWYHVFARSRMRSDTATVFLDVYGADGSHIFANNADFNGSQTNQAIRFGYRGGDDQFYGDMALWAHWYNFLEEWEMQRLVADPFGPIRPRIMPEAMTQPLLVPHRPTAPGFSIG